MEKGLPFLGGNNKCWVYSHTCTYPRKILLCLARTGMEPHLPKQRILLPDRAFVVTVLDWELRKPFLLQLPGDFGQIFFSFAHPGF